MELKTDAFQKRRKVGFGAMLLCLKVSLVMSANSCTRHTQKREPNVLKLTIE